MGMFDSVMGIRGMGGYGMAPPELPGVGAKPLYSTPPFAPPHAQTGGAEIPTTTGTRPAKHGLAGFFGRAVQDGALGDLGSMIAALGTNSLPQVMQSIQQRHAENQRRQGEAGQYQQRRQDEMSDWQSKYDYEAVHPKPSTAGPHYWESNDGSLHAIGQDGKPTEVFHDPTPKQNFIPDGLGGGRWETVPGTGGPMASPAAGPPAIGTVVDDPRKAPGQPQAGGYGAFKKAIIGLESGGRYGVANTEGSGAMGLGQIMPQTARVLAGRLGLPYSPSLLAGRDPASQEYQNRLTGAATQEAWDAGHNDPRAAAMYYFGGSDHSKYGPKTRRYANDILGRMRG